MKEKIFFVYERGVTAVGVIDILREIYRGVFEKILDPELVLSFVGLSTIIAKLKDELREFFMIMKKDIVENYFQVMTTAFNV